MKQRGECPGTGRAEDNQPQSTAESVLAETAWTTLKEEEHKEQGKRERAATYKTSRLVVPLRSGNSLMSVAPLSDLQRNEDGVRWTEEPQPSAAAQGPRPIRANLLPHTLMGWSEAQGPPVTSESLLAGQGSRCLAQHR